MRSSHNSYELRLECVVVEKLLRWTSARDEPLLTPYAEPSSWVLYSSHRWQ